MSKIVKKISPKTLGCQNVGDSFQIFGRISTYRKVSTNIGESFQLSGLVRAINNQTGEVFEGPSCFLPGGYDAMFVQQLTMAQDQDKFATIELCHHFSKNEADNPMGSEWVMQSISKNVGGSSALDEIQNNALPVPTAKKLEDHSKKKAKK